MAWSTIDMNWEGDQSNYHKFHTTDHSQAQAHSFPLLSPGHDWRWTGDTSPESTSNWNAVSSSQAMPTVSGDLHWSTRSPKDAVNATSTSFDNPTPNSSLNYSLETTPAFFSHVDHISPGGQSLELPSQASHDEATYNNEVYNRALRPQPHARFQTTTKRTKIYQQSHDRPLSEPIRCKWDGCRYSGTFKRESLLIRHLKNIHFYPGAHPCPIQNCDMVCNRADNLTQHMRNIHSLGQSFPSTGGSAY